MERQYHTGNCWTDAILYDVLRAWVMQYITSLFSKAEARQLMDHITIARADGKWMFGITSEPNHKWVEIPDGIAVI